MQQQSSITQNVCYINGQWLSAKHSMTVYNPFNQEMIGQIPQCDEYLVNQAIDSANNALPKWRSLGPKQRAEILSNWSELIKQHQTSIANTLTLEQGKPLSEAQGEIDYARSFIDWFAAEGLRTYGDLIPAAKTNLHYLVHKQSIGVVAAITPWNFPAAMITRKCAPALAAGCTLVLKPSEQTPFTALCLADLAKQAGFPPGVINVITGDPASIGQQLCAAPEVKKLSFTGSTQVGKLLIKQCADSVKKLSLELGGNAPFIVFADADLDAAITGLMQSKFRNSGQTCVCPNRLFLHDEIKDAFIEKLLTQVQTLKVGNGLQGHTDIGPLINQAAIDKVQRLLADATEKGARILHGGNIHATYATCFEPTILTDVDQTMAIAHEEIFGPVVAIYSFNEEQRVIEQANATEYGLASYAYTQDLARTWRLMDCLDSGIISINSGSFSNASTPFGGVKQSGFGREGSKYGIDEYLQLKYICLRA